jgi:hypothetical protein
MYVCNSFLRSFISTSITDYQQEDKWTFLVSGAKNDVPVTPFMDSKALVIKHKSIEGGMGIHFFRNALDGGDWIIQV